MHKKNIKSPEYLRVSLAAAMTLGLVEGKFYRNAKLGCINILLTYPEGCKANCSFCGLAKGNPYKNDFFYEKFIRVYWPVFAFKDVYKRCSKVPGWVRRVCISQVTHPNVHKDTLFLCKELKKRINIPVSVLISPTVSSYDDLLNLKKIGVDRIGIAIDAATPRLFKNLRGHVVKGPHSWKHYWNIFMKALDLFGPGYVGIHLICGLGETEKDIIRIMSKIRELGGTTHLFCFFPEKYSVFSNHSRPDPSVYRRVQLARWLIDFDLVNFFDFVFDYKGRVRDFGLNSIFLDEIIDTGFPFMTSGCPGILNEVACNRPFGNERPGIDLRNYPFILEENDLNLVRKQLNSYLIA